MIANKKVIMFVFVFPIWIQAIENFKIKNKI